MNEKKGELVGIPLISLILSDHLYTSHLARLSYPRSILRSSMGSNVVSGFTPGVDVWKFTIYGTFSRRTGIATAVNLGMWYYNNGLAQGPRDYSAVRQLGYGVTTGNSCGRFGVLPPCVLIQSKINWDTRLRNEQRTLVENIPGGQ
jgi:hypothetical protein